MSDPRIVSIDLTPLVRAALAAERANGESGTVSPREEDAGEDSTARQERS